jgi:hypothetical protein
VLVLAVDWSGKLKQAAEFIWLAEVRDGVLVSLQNGRSREALVEHLIAIAEQEPRTVVGFDFAFSFPQWWCEQRRWRRAPQAWTAMARDGDRLLQECEPPFWGRRGKPNPNPLDRRFRKTELVDVKGAKSW